MANSKRILLSSKSRKSKNRILVHRKTDQFKDFVRLVREAHARMATTKNEQAVELARA